MSQEDVEQLIRKRIQTTMIGALARFEENFGHLWGHFKDPSDPLTPRRKVCRHLGLYKKSNP